MGQCCMTSHKGIHYKCFHIYMYMYSVFMYTGIGYCLIKPVCGKIVPARVIGSYKNYTYQLERYRKWYLYLQMW